ncbi:type VI secretion-associated protein [Salmonella enterica subsp. enterica]|nr:type VI secretion-associated protein [Salmonella enterica subsp. enterica]
MVITTPAIGNVPPRPVLMFSLRGHITRMQVALTHPMTPDSIDVTLTADTRQIRSRWFIRENGPCWSPAGLIRHRRNKTTFRRKNADH